MVMTSVFQMFPSIFVNNPGARLSSAFVIWSLLGALSFLRLAIAFLTSFSVGGSQLIDKM
jgi:hypothetical protein